MDDKMIECRRDDLCIEAVDPKNGKTCKVWLSYDRLQWVKQFGAGRIYEAAYVATHVLRRPTAIFEGLCEDGDEAHRGFGWRCYCGIPPCEYNDDGSERPWRADRVFCVFVTIDGIAYNWVPVPCDPEDPELPERHVQRFKKRVL